MMPCPIVKSATSASDATGATSVDEQTSNVLSRKGLLADCCLLGFTLIAFTLQLRRRPTDWVGIV